MAYSAISKPSLHFNTKIYTGNGSTNALTGVGFQPDFVWLKRRDAAAGHKLNDAVRGVNKQLVSNNNNAETSNTDILTAFGTDGFTLGSNSDVNGNNNSYVSWNWKANGQGSANTDGTINSTYTSANTSSGFSIVKYNGTGSAGTVGHGLGVAPEMIMVKRLNQQDGWTLFNSYLGSNDAYFYLNTNDPSSTSNGSSLWNSTAPTSSVFSLNTNSAVNGSGSTYIAYCFASKKGFSKLSNYVGNASTDGPFIYTGFKPAFLLIKSYQGGSDWWGMSDNKRQTAVNNDARQNLLANTADNEGNLAIDYFSNGFKLRNTNTGTNGNNSWKYIFMAFAAEPLVANVGQGIPATAR